MGIHHSRGPEMRRILLFTFPPFLSLQVFGLLKQAVDIPITTGWRRDFKVKEGNETLFKGIQGGRRETEPHLLFIMRKPTTTH